MSVLYCNVLGKIQYHYMGGGTSENTKSLPRLGPPLRGTCSLFSLNKFSGSSVLQ